MNLQNNRIAEYCGLDTSSRRTRIPDYFNDLNAMALAEKALPTMGKQEYFERYLPFTSGAQTEEQGPIDLRKLASASAAQRAEAFILAIA